MSIKTISRSSVTCPKIHHDFMNVINDLQYLFDIPITHLTPKELSDAHCASMAIYGPKDPRTLSFRDEIESLVIKQEYLDLKSKLIQLTENYNRLESEIS